MHTSNIHGATLLLSPTPCSMHTSRYLGRIFLCFILAGTIRYFFYLATYEVTKAYGVVVVNTTEDEVTGLLVVSYTTSNGQICKDITPRVFCPCPIAEKSLFSEVVWAHVGIESLQHMVHFSTNCNSQLIMRTLGQILAHVGKCIWFILYCTNSKSYLHHTNTIPHRNYNGATTEQ
jgi:hypothetical protein